MRSEDLISQLVAEARPVRRLRSPFWQAAIWLGVAFAVLTIVVAWHGLRPGLAERIVLAEFLIPWLASVATGVLAVVAAFHLALPDRTDRWRLAPLPTLALWAASLGAGCYRDWLQVGPQGLALGTSFSCLAAIVLSSVPLGGLLFFMVRHAGPIRPLSTALTGALAVASLSSAALDLFHGLDAAIMIFVWHVGSVALVVAVLGQVGRAALIRATPRLDPTAA